MLKLHLENFEHYFVSMWDECNCAVVGAFFGIAFLWDWNETDLFQSCGHCWVFQICWHIECSTFIVSSFRIWSSSTGIPWPPLALFVVTFHKAHLILHSRMSGSRWLITPSWLSGSLTSFLYATPWTISLKAPLATEFSREEYWSGLPCPFPEIFPTQGSNLGLLHCRQPLYHLNYSGIQIHTHTSI